MYRHVVGRLILLSLLAGLAGVALLVSGTAAQLIAMMNALAQLQPGTLGASLALSALSALLSGALWWRLVGRLGRTVPFRAGLAAYLHAGLAGYVVNFAGPVLGSALSLRRHGVGAGQAVVLTLIANVLGFCGILVWAPVGLVLLSHAGIDTALPIVGAYGPAAVGGAIVALMVAMLLVLRLLASAACAEHRVMRLLLGHARASAGAALPALCYRQLLALVPYSAASWVAGALPLYLVLAALRPGAGLTLSAVIGAAVIAAALGSLAFFAPEGVGVKDGVLVLLLSHATGLPLSTGLAAALAVRALDPLTKLVLLGVLALPAIQPPARRFVGGAARRAQVLGMTLRWRGGVARTRRCITILGAGVLALAAVLGGSSAFAQADQDVSARREPPVLVQSVDAIRSGEATWSAVAVADRSSLGE